MPWSCLRAASQAETQADRTRASREPDSRCHIELGRTTSDTPLDRSCIGLMRVLANGSKVLTGWSSRMANCFCFGLTLCIYSEEMHAWAELCRLGHGPRAEAIVAHATARMFFPAGERRGVGTPLRLIGNKAELIPASARGRRARRTPRPYERAVRRSRANII